MDSVSHDGDKRAPGNAQKSTTVAVWLAQAITSFNMLSFLMVYELQCCSANFLMNMSNFIGVVQEPVCERQLSIYRAVQLQD